VKFIVVDIDGTIADTTTRGNYANSQFKKDSEIWWDALMDPSLVYLDKPILFSGMVLRIYYDRGYEIIYLTGRPDYMREETRKWLENNNFPDGRLFMTPSLYISSHSDIVSNFKGAAVRKLNRMGNIRHVFDDNGINLMKIAAERIPDLELHLVQENSEDWWKKYLYTKMSE